MSAIEDDVLKMHHKTLCRGLPEPLMSVTSVMQSPWMAGPWATPGTRLWGMEQRPVRPLRARSSVDLAVGGMFLGARYYRPFSLTQPRS